MSNRIVVKADEQRLLFAEVYSPLHVDTDGEAMTAEDIRKMAHNFLASGRVTKIDVQHNQKESGCVVVESFIARKNDPDGFIKDSWVLGIHVPSDDVWEAVKKGELNGLSFFGSVQKVPARARVIVTRKMVGQTEESMAGLLPAHSHDVTINFSENGRVMEGFTERAVGHTHRITKATATETDWDHGHRLVLVENDEEEKVEKGELQFSWKPTEEESNRFVALMEEDVEKGGPGSGSWNGPGDPRFQWSRQARANRSVEESLALGEDEEGAGAISRTIGEIFKYEKDLKKRFPVVRKVLEDQERKYELTGNPYMGLNQGFSSGSRTLLWS